MKVLWLCNRNPIELNIKNSGGWLSALSEILLNSRNEMIYVFPSDRFFETNCQDYHLFEFKNSFFTKPYTYKKKFELFFIKILESLRPDIIHIWGTEYAYDLAMVNAAKKTNLINKTIIHIQGLCFEIAEHLTIGLPFRVVFGRTPRDFLLGNINKQKKWFLKRSENEKLILKSVKNVTGRTFWDKRCCLLINKQLNYYYCNESLRHAFYFQSWKYSECKKHSIFISQASYSLKGFHVFLNAFRLVLNEYPDASVYVSGTDVIRSNGGIVSKLSISRYGLHIRKILKKNKMNKSVHFLGPLNQYEMAAQYKKANVFVMCSFIENSPNSVGEALSIGTPIVASSVGGISEFINDRQNGYLYSPNDYYLLASYIMSLFESEEQCDFFSKNGKELATKLFDRDTIKNDVLKIYSKLLMNK